jgi:lipopolysaccharide export system permease protein
MTILARYLAREFGKLFALCLATFVFLYLLVDFIEQSSAFFRAHADGADVLRYFVFKLPLVVFQMIPAAVLLATLLVLTLLSKNSEITAMKAGGVSLYRIVAPLLACAAALSGFSFLLNEYVVPVTNERAEFVKRVDIKGRQPAVRHKRKRVWYKSASGIYSIGIYHTVTREMRDVTIYEFAADFALARRIDARRAVWTGAAWEFQDGVVRTFDRNRFVAGERFDRRVIPIEAVPDDLATIAKSSDEMSARELSEFVDKVAGEGMDVTRYRVDLQGKYAFPLVGLVMALLAVPFALRGGRQGGVALGIGLAVGIGVVYWLALGTFLSLGNSGRLPPTVAAWGSHVLFCGIGMVLLVRAPK